MMSYRKDETSDSQESVQANLLKGTDMHDLLKPKETWQQDAQETDLWHGAHGVIVNSIALREREFFYEVVRVSNN